MIRFPLAKPDLGDEEKLALIDCIDSNWISSTGSYVTKFESLFVGHFGPGEAVAVVNGTLAIDLALIAVGVVAGDEVLVPNLTFAGSVSPILRLQAIPVLVPSRPDHWNMDASKLEALITPKTKAIVAVHLYGVPCDILDIRDIALRHGLALVEDCAEALGAKVEGRFVGTFGDIGCYSFFGNKVLTTGEGGMCLARNKDFAETLRHYRDHGMKPGQRYWHTAVGYNARMSNLQGAVGFAQFKKLDTFIARRREIHEIYSRCFKACRGLLSPTPAPGVEDVIWLESPVLARGHGLDRDRLLSHLQGLGIETRPFFYPIAAMPAYAHCGTVDADSAYFSGHGFNLPTYTGMSDDDVREIAGHVVEWIEREARWDSGITVDPRYPG